MKPRRARARIGLAALSAVLVILATGVISGCAGQSYQCGDNNSNHCYGTVAWSGNPTGLSMEETPVALTSGDIFVDDEAWLVDYSSGPTSWVETGEVNEGYGTDYFWAYSTGGVSGFMTYDLGAVSPSDMNGTWIAYQIRQSPRESTGWAVTISRAASGTVLYAPSPADVTMTPNTVIEGQELAGEEDAQAPIAFFTENSVFQGSTETLQTTAGSVTDDTPPNAGWLGSDIPSPATTDGGMFVTDCC